MDLTFCILTFNSTSTLTVCMKSIMNQGILPNILIFDNGSKDGTVEMIKAQIKYNCFPGAKIELIEDLHQNRGQLGNIAHSRYMISQRVKTEYMMFVDSDVLLPSLIVGRLMIEIKKPDMGMIGVRYEPLADHVKMGAAILKTEYAKQSRWKAVPKCECSHLKDELEEKGLRVEYHKDFQALHLKNYL